MNEKWSKIVPSSVCGLIAGGFVFDVVPASWPWWVKLGFAAFAGVGIGVVIRRKSEPPLLEEWKALVMGSGIAFGIGLILGIISWAQTNSPMMVIPWFTLGTVTFVWWIIHWAQMSRRPKIPDEESDADGDEPADQADSAETDPDMEDTQVIDRVETADNQSDGEAITIDDVTILHPRLRQSLLKKAVGLALDNEEHPHLSETVYVAAIGYHWWKFVTRAYIPLIVASFFVWGAIDYAGWSQLVDSLTHGYRMWGLVIAMVFAVWRVKATGSWKRFFRRTKGFSLGIAFGLWWFLGFPGATWLRESFESGAPGPYLLLSGLSLAWGFVESSQYFFGGTHVSHFRIVLAQFAPRPIANSPSYLDLSTVNTTSLVESSLGNFFGMIGSIFGREWAFCYIKWDAPTSGDADFNRAGPYRYKEGEMLQKQSENARIQLQQGVYAVAPPERSEDTTQVG